MQGSTVLARSNKHGLVQLSWADARLLKHRFKETMACSLALLGPVCVVPQQCHNVCVYGLQETVVINTELFTVAVAGGTTYLATVFMPGLHFK